MARRLKVLLLVHPYFRPDRKGPPRSPSERHVWLGLRRLGHSCEVSVAQNSLRELESDLKRCKPDVVFNLLEEFADEGVFDFHPISFLQKREVPFTGCGPLGLIHSRHKLWSALAVRSAGIAVPECGLWGDEAVRKLKFPVFLKYNSEHASLGITERNRATTWAALRRRARQLRERHTDEILVQEFIPGREYNVSVWGNSKPQTFAPWELYLGGESAFATERIKFSQNLQRRRWILARRFRGDTQLARALRAAAQSAYSALGLSGYARMDFRVNPEGKMFLIDANANPNLAKSEDFVLAARHSGWDYEDVLQKIIRLGREAGPKSVGP